MINPYAPQVAVQRVGWRWRWDLCMLNKVTVWGWALTRRGAARRGHKFARRVQVAAAYRDLSDGERYLQRATAPITLTPDDEKTILHLLDRPTDP